MIDRFSVSVMPLRASAVCYTVPVFSTRASRAERGLSTGSGQTCAPQGVACMHRGHTTTLTTLTTHRQSVSPPRTLRAAGDGTRIGKGDQLIATTLLRVRGAA